MPNPQSQYAYLLTDLYQGASVFHDIQDLADWVGVTPAGLQESFEALHKKYGYDHSIGISGGTMQRVILNPEMPDHKRTERLACFLAGLFPKYDGGRDYLEGTQQLGRSLGLSETTIDELTDLLGTTTSDKFYRLVSAEANQVATYIESRIEERFEDFVDHQIKRIAQLADIPLQAPQPN